MVEYQEVTQECQERMGGGVSRNLTASIGELRNNAQLEVSIDFTVSGRILDSGAQGCHRVGRKCG
jgi:hypothetical protein